MQFPAQFSCVQQATSATRRHMQNSQVLLVGFDEATSRTITEFLNALSFEAHFCDEPFGALASLIEDPGAWMACIVNAKTFPSDAAVGRNLHLFAFEGKAIGMILGNADPETLERHASDPICGVDEVVCNINDPNLFLQAMTSVMARRGFFPAEPEIQVRRPSAPDLRAARSRRTQPSFFKARRSAQIARSVGHRPLRAHCGLQQYENI
jgi:hypothetical protein